MNFGLGKKMLTKYGESHVPSKAWEKEMGKFNDFPKHKREIDIKEFMAYFTNEIFDYEEFRQPSNKVKSYAKFMGNMKMFIKLLEVAGKELKFGVAMLDGVDGEPKFFVFNEEGWRLLADHRSRTMY